MKNESKKNKVVVKDALGNKFMVDKNDPKYLSGEYISIHKGTVTVKDPVSGKNMRVLKDDPRYLSGELVHTLVGKINAKDEHGNIFKVESNDSRLLSGELQHVWKGKKHSAESKQKIGNTNKIKQKGELNSQYQTKWISNGIYSKKVPALEVQEWIQAGWVLGSKSSNDTQRRFKNKEKSHQSKVEFLTLFNQLTCEYVKIYFEGYLTAVNKKAFPKLTIFIRNSLSKSKLIEEYNVKCSKIKCSNLILVIEYTSSYNRTSTPLILNIKEILLNI